jgi:hypothetical protein
MKTIARSLAFAAALAAALPLAARADRRDDDHDGRRGLPPPAHGMPAPDHGHGPGQGPYRRHDWRSRELARIRAEMAALDARRAWFHQRWAGRPGKLRQFDRWYFVERAALERRWGQLAWTAMR